MAWGTWPCHPRRSSGNPSNNANRRRPRPTPTGIPGVRRPVRPHSFVEEPAVPGDLIVAERHGASVGHVVRLGQGVEAQLGPDRVLHLLLGGPAAPRERLFDPQRRVTEDRHTPQGRRQHDHPARVRHEDRRPRVLRVAMHLLQRQCRGPEGVEDLEHPLVDQLEPPVHRPGRDCPGAGSTPAPLDHKRSAARGARHSSPSRPAPGRSRARARDHDVRGVFAPSRFDRLARGRHGGPSMDRCRVGPIPPRPANFPLSTCRNRPGCARHRTKPKTRAIVHRSFQVVQIPSISRDFPRKKDYPRRQA